MTFDVRPFGLSDVAGAMALLAGAGWGEGSLPQPFVLADANRFGAAFLATSGDQTVGFVRVISDRATVSYVTEIVTAPEWRQQGVGRALLDACTVRFPKARIDLLSSQMAQPFYERAGFTAKPGYRRWP